MEWQRLQAKLSEAHFTDQLAEIYGEDKESTSEVIRRLKSLAHGFARRFRAEDVYFVRAPGRVNLIGEHTDYNGYPVMPMAVNRDILIAAAATGEPVVRLGNTEPAFPERQFSLEDEITPYETGDWGNYVKAAVQGLLPLVRQQSKKVNGFSAVYDGNIPGAAGLSSSSAMVVASALAFLRANQMHIDKLELAERLARAEHFVGTQGGGMDQAISLLAEKGAALRIDFFPLRVHPQPLHPDYRVVVCNSLIRAPKTESAMQEYNRRPVECRIATALIANAIGVPLAQAKRMADLEQFPGYKQRKKELLAQVLSPPVMTLAQICGKLHLSEAECREKFLKLKSGSYFSPPADGFKPAQRFKHVIEEAQRVELAAEALSAGAMERFGELMNASHRSCRDLYEISTPEMDKLVEIARDNGAIGARLTGAGFGGCTVNLVPKEKVASFLQGVRTDYYETYLSQTHPQINWRALPAASLLFPTLPVRGADVIWE